jgi:hypothetical protein
MTRTLSSGETSRNVEAVSSMTIPRIPTRKGLRDAIMASEEPVKSALVICDWMDSEVPSKGWEGRVDGPGSVEFGEDEGGRGGRLRRLDR